MQHEHAAWVASEAEADGRTRRLEVSEASVALDRLAVARWVEEEGEDGERRARLIADALTPALERLPRIEREMVHMHYRRRMTQRQIAAIYGVSQPAVHWRLARARARLRYLLAAPSVTEEQLRDDLGAELGPEDVDMLARLWRSTSLTDVATQLGVPHSTLRHRVGRCMARLAASTDDALAPYRALFSALASAGWGVLYTQRRESPYRASHGS